MKSSHFLVIAAAVFTFSWAPVLPAALYELNGNTVVIPNPNGDLIVSNSFIKSGTGIFGPFLTIQNNRGTEEGYNSVTQPLDTKRAPQDTHELIKSQLVTSTSQAGVDYYSFLIDINESNNPLTSFITVDALKIYTSPTLVNNPAELVTKGTLRFDLDAFGIDNTLLYNDANSGSGQGDIAFFVPVSAFVTVPDNYFVYIYQQFGATPVPGPPAGSDGGFEETRLEPGIILVTPVPEVGSLVPLIAVLGAVLGGPFVRRGFGKLNRQTA